jgi:hypothetical protein
MLLGNYSPFNKLPLRFRAGRNAAGESFAVRSCCRPGWSYMIWQDGASESLPYIGYPSGYYDRGWKLPLGVSSTSTKIQFISGMSALLSLAASGTGSKARPGIGSATITISAGGTAGLVVLGIGDASFTIDASADIVARLLAEGSATFEISANGDTLEAWGWPVGSADITITAEADPRAIGWMDGTTAYSEELTAEIVAEAVWDAIATQYDLPGTMGEKLNNAASGNVDYDALSDAVWQRSIESSLSAEEITRVILAAIAGKRQGLGTSTQIYMAQDGVTPRVTLVGFDQNGNGTPVVDGSS